jgi:serine phosphatase RsbU (regulator of sigma subunit)
VAEDGQEAWERFQAEPVDVVVSDMLMPGLSGLELVQHIRGGDYEGAADRGYTYVIMLTGLSERQHVMAGMAAGADDYLTKPLDPDDLQHRLTVAERITGLQRLLAEQKVSLERYAEQLEEEIDVARRIQTALLPRDLGIEAHALSMEMRPASQVGGDLIDYLPQPDGRFWLAIGDVTGHGLTAGLIMMMTQSMLATLVGDQPDMRPSALLTKLNRTLHANVKFRLRNDNYLTLQLIRHLGGGRYVTAGMHGPMLIYRAATNQVEQLEVPGMWVGLLDDIDEYTYDVDFSLAPGDVLLLFTDGLIEAKNAAREQYDLPRLEALFAACAHLPVEQIRQILIGAVDAWLDVQADDISVIVLRHQPEALEASIPPAGGAAKPVRKPN